jgi:hypothetical protein
MAAAGASVGLAGGPRPTSRRSSQAEISPAAAVSSHRGVAARATVYACERWRCNPCGEIATAPAQEGIGTAKYDARATSMVGLPLTFGWPVAGANPSTTPRGGRDDLANAVAGALVTALRPPGLLTSSMSEWTYATSWSPRGTAAMVTVVRHQLT